jgi:plastocyanin
MDMKRVYLIPFVVVGMLGCGGGGGDEKTASTEQAAADFTVQVKNYSFDPPVLNVKAGQTVEWVIAQGSHDIVSGSKDGEACTPDGKFSTSLLSTGKTFRYTFDKAGAYPYFCSPHCSQGQVGTVNVEPGPGSSQ